MITKRNQFFEQVANFILAHRPDNFSRVEINYKWHMDKSRAGPSLCFTGNDGRSAGIDLISDAYKPLANLFHRNANSLRDESAPSSPQLPNLLKIIVNADGSYQGEMTFSSQVDIEYEQEMRSALGDETYERYERERQEELLRLAEAGRGVAESVPAMNEDSVPAKSSMRSPVDAAAESMSVPELLGFIHAELTKDLPADWHTLEVEGEVWKTDDGFNNVRTLYHYTRSGSATRHQLSASNIFGPTNAITALQKRMAAEGKAWRKVFLKFEAGSDMTWLDTDSPSA